MSKDQGKGFEHILRAPLFVLYIKLEIIRESDPKSIDNQNNLNPR